MSLEDRPASTAAIPDAAAPRRRKYVPAIGPRLKVVLGVVLGLFALLGVNSAYLLGVSLLEWWTGSVYQNWFYMNMFLVHLVLGALIVVPVVVFGILHIKNAHNRPNRRAVYMGYALFSTALVLLASGIVLTRLEGVIVVQDPKVRSFAYWAHVATPVVAAWLFVLHRLAGRKIRWRVGLRWAAVAAAFAVVLVIWQAQDPRSWNVVGPVSGERYFFPSLARTATGDFIPERVLDNDEYCLKCHADSYRGWEHSVHRVSSFNNPPYLFAVQETREKVSIQASRWCAGCHDPVVFYSGKFDDPAFNDIEFARRSAAGQAGITCTVCHSITHVNSVRGNADYTIEQPIHYPFAFSDNETLFWVNQQLIKAKPDFHKKTFLKPLHRSAEFCSTCHKVHLPPEVNSYKWLRGQNHYDAYLLSGVSGHGVLSFYYPEKATHNCSGCHMPLSPSEQFAARDFDASGTRKIHNHQFPGANTAIPALLEMPAHAIETHRAFNEGVMRLDLFGVKGGGAIDGPLTAPLRPEVPTLEPGRAYLLEAVVRTVKMGHQFTQGTVDSNEVWVDVRVLSGGRVIGRSGGLGPANEVDPWSHFVNVYMLDRKGNRIDRRNPQDIFVPLYNHQIPPGAADVVHLLLELPEDVSEPVTVEARLQYRKFDTTYMRQVTKKLEQREGYVNELPILTLAMDRVTFPVTGAPFAEPQKPPVPPELVWQRWNDYGIALLLKGGKSKGELRQAEEAFTKVEELGRPDGPLNLARVYIAQGTVQDKAIAALARAASFDPPAPSWSVAWFTGVVNKQNGYLDQAIADFESILELDDAVTRKREFDFSQDYRLLDELGQTIFERAKAERDPARRQEMMREAVGYFERTLTLEPEDLAAHYNLALLYRQLGDTKLADQHLAFHRRYKPDDNARDFAVAEARRKDPAANHAAEAIVIYDLARPGAYELQDAEPGGERRAARYEVKPLPKDVKAAAGEATAGAGQPRLAHQEAATEEGGLRR